MELLLSKLDEKLNQQAKLITEAVTTNVMNAIDERINTLTKENTVLKSKISKIEQKLNILEKEKRKYNLILFGIEENEKSKTELVDNVKDIIIESGTHLDSQEISNIYRIGKKYNNKNRPIVVSLTSTWKKQIIQKNKAELPQGIYIKEDFPKEVLEKRKQLQPQLEEERKKGNLAFLKYDKLIVKGAKQTRDKRKRENSGSPNASSSQKKMDIKDIPTTSTSKGRSKENFIKPTILNYVEREKSTSVSETPKN